MKKTLLLIITSYFIFFIAFAHKINAYKSDNSTKTDAIIVLTGGKNRIQEGIKMMDNNLATKMFISGVSKQTSKKDLNISHNKDIELGYAATTTFENGIEVKEWINTNNIKTIRLVTSNYHLPRSLLEIKNQNKNIKVIESPIYSDNINKRWWTSLKTTSFIFIEFNKFIYVYIRNLI